MSRDNTTSAIIGAVAAAVALYTLTLVDENVLASVDNINCVATPLVATAAMIFSSRDAADAKSIVGQVPYKRVIVCFRHV